MTMVILILSQLLMQLIKIRKLVAVTHMSNVLGTIVDVKTICHAAKSFGVATLIDGSQGAVHMPVDVQEIGCDFYPITGHKLCGPSGSGAIYVKAERMEEMRPFLGGGDMIKEVHKDSIIYNDAPMKFEAGTPGIVETIGFGGHAHDISFFSWSTLCWSTLDHMGIASCRASFAFYNTKAEVDT